MKSRLAALVAALAMLATALTFAPVAQATHEPACTNTPYVWFYGDSIANQDSGDDEIKFCYGQYINSMQLKTIDDDYPSESCKGFLGIVYGNFNNCLTGISASASGWNNSITLCVYNDEYYSKAAGWSYVTYNIGTGNLDSSLNDKISSVRWVTGGGSNC